MVKRVAVVQSNYIPWKGYFDLIRSVDEFILFDDVQFTRRDWRNRNRIKTPDGPRWLTIPVKVKGQFEQRIRDTQIDDHGWPNRHWASIAHAYARAPHFKEYAPFFDELYAGTTESSLSQVNFRFLSAICEVLGIRTKLSWSMDYRLIEGKTERLLDLCQQAGATEYVSGPLARSYMDESLFAQAGVALSWMDYSGYPEYRQLYPPFDHYVTVLDLIFNEGENAIQYLDRFTSVPSVEGAGG